MDKGKYQQIMSSRDEILGNSRNKKKENVG
jgi:hypothetical protein